jgi:hypothetical protein
MQDSARGWLWAVGLIAAVVLGAGFRLVWVMDMEYKGDETWTFTRTQQVGVTEPFPWIGMPSSGKVNNPGMSLWLFLALAKAFGVVEPPELARAVQLLNIAALGLLIVFAWIWVEKTDRELWWWGTALGAVNPLAVLSHRKIWPPSALPLFTLVFLVGWWHRHLTWGAFLWGLTGACLGQIHMAGFFFAAGVVIWAFFFDRKQTAWRDWLIGSCLGAVPLVPWAYDLWMKSPTGAISLKWTRWFEFWKHWITEPFGIGLKYSLGGEFPVFLGYPIVDGHPTYFVGVLHLFLILLGITILGRGVSWLWQDRRRWRDLWIGSQSPTVFTVNGVLCGYGLLLTVSGLPFYRHYLLVTFPLPFVWVAWLAFGPAVDRPGRVKAARVLLLTLCVCESLLAASFLFYIHLNGGAIEGDYGIAYGAQAGR